jgi:SPP1 family predicted phage head-tail adaptor
MRAGSLRHRIEVLKPTRTQDLYGQEVLSFVSVGERWAAVEFMSGKELNYARQAQARSTHKITMRFDSDIKPSWRVRHGDATYDIESVGGDGMTSTVMQAVEVMSG